jgi:hypothetical protein
MKIGMVAIKKSKQCGIPALHIEALKQAAIKNNTPIAIRPINPLAEYYLDAGYPTKEYNIKIKTSDRGVASGLIPVVPKFSRLAQHNQDDLHELQTLLQSLHIEITAPMTKQQLGELVAHPNLSYTYGEDLGVVLRLKKDHSQHASFYLKWDKEIKCYEFSGSEETQNRHALEKSMQNNPDLTTKALIVTQERLTVLKNLLGEQLRMELAENSKDYILAWKRGNALIQAYAKWNEANNNYDVVDEHNDPLLVLAKQIAPGDIRYITTDYDLLVICPTYKSFEPGGQDRTPFRTQGADPQKNQLAVNQSHEEEDYSGPQEDENRGNISPRTADTIALINEEIAQKDPQRAHPGLETVHHNAEFHNPFADELEKNTPSLMVFPIPIDLSPIAHLIDGIAQAQLKQVSEILIETSEEMSLIRDLLYDQGYYWPSHAQSNQRIKPFKSEQLSAVQNAIEKMHTMRAELVVIRHAAKESPLEEQEEPSLPRIVGSK